MKSVDEFKKEINSMKNFSDYQRIVTEIASGFLSDISSSYRLWKTADKTAYLEVIKIISKNKTDTSGQCDTLEFIESYSDANTKFSHLLAEANKKLLAVNEDIREEYDSCARAMLKIPIM